MQTIVVAYDASDSARLALERAADLAQAFGAKLIATSVSPVMQGASRVGGGIDPTDPPERHAEQLQEAQALLSARGVEADAVAAVGHPEEAIVAVAKEHGADLIVVGSHGAGLAARILGQSVSDGVVHRAPCDVYVAHQR